MRRIVNMLLILAALTLGVRAAGANTETQRIHRRDAMQRERIHAGWKKGDLTRGERRHLRHGQAHIRRMERRAGRDGKITPREGRRIERAQDRQSQRIHRLRHNARRRAA